jgi:hypothetical protein
MVKIAGLFIAWFALWLGYAGTFRPEPVTFTTDKLSTIGPIDTTGKLKPGDVQAGELSTNPVLKSWVESGGATMNAARTPSGRARDIQVDEDGYVICSTKGGR